MPTASTRGIIGYSRGRRWYLQAPWRWPGASGTSSSGGLPISQPTTAARRGRPSAWWRFGQDRRFELIRAHAALAGSRALDLGCGLGAYTSRLVGAGAEAVGVEVEILRGAAAREQGVSVAVAVGEALPFAGGTFDLVLLHEVLEHVADDRRTMAEVSRVLAVGGRALVFVPNRGWPFETHGVLWRGDYVAGNIPLINYLPDPLRNRLAPHVRSYTRSGLRRASAGLPLREVYFAGVFPGYDKLAARRPAVGRLARRVSYSLERRGLDRLALSHFQVLERVEDGGVAVAWPYRVHEPLTPSGTAA